MTRYATPLEGTNATHYFQRFLEKAELAYTCFPDLRHTCATILIALGVHPGEILDILGHSQISATMNLYGHVFPELPAARRQTNERYAR